jgi:hypothetical protein
MLATFADAFARHVASATARQLALGDGLEDRPWAVEIRAGTAPFGELTFAIQLLGTEAEGDNSWLWAWANDGSSLPEPILLSSRRLRAIGETRGPKLLATPALSLMEWSGHQIAMVCTGLLGTASYYRGPYDGGALSRRKRRSWSASVPSGKQQRAEKCDSMSISMDGSNRPIWRKRAAGYRCCAFTWSRNAIGRKDVAKLIRGPESRSVGSLSGEKTP